jgi:hypothetical protein
LNVLRGLNGELTAGFILHPVDVVGCSLTQVDWRADRTRHRCLCPGCDEREQLAFAFVLFFAIAANHVINKEERSNSDTDNYLRIIASALIPLFICLLIGVGVAGIAEDFKRWMVSFFVIYFAYQVGRLSMAAHTKKPE